MNNNNNESEEISIKEVILKLKAGWHYLFAKWLVIMLGGLIGGIIGLTYAYTKKPVYTATSTFVLEDSKSGGLSNYTGLASIAGIDLGGSGSSGIFQGDNILELYKSRIMIEKTLLSTVNISGKRELLIDRYINFNHLRDEWKKKDQINSVFFNGDPDKFNRNQDSIINNIIEIFNKNILSVDKPDKKLSIIKVSVTTKDELFSKVFNNKLVETVNEFYTQTKTKKSYQNVIILQKQADSVRRVLNSSISGVAAAIDAAPNANPNQLSLRVPSQRKQVDVQASSAIYGEIVRNLELSKLTLRQEAPLIQLIDEPVLPLPITRVGKLKGILLGGFLGGFLIVGYLSIQKLFTIIIK